MSQRTVVCVDVAYGDQPRIDWGNVGHPKKRGSPYMKGGSSKQFHHTHPFMKHNMVRNLQKGEGGSLSHQTKCAS